MVIAVVAVEPRTDLLAKVRELWRRHSDTLGFFPEGAFDDHANKRCILAAVGSDGILLGYTLFRTTHRGKASIAHLCVVPEARGRGVARQLFDALKPMVSNCDDIVVRCRRDFAAATLWPRLGFEAVGEENGRGKDAEVVTIWRHELNRLPLLAAMDRHRDDVMQVVIDANVFFDLDEDPGTATRDESKSLMADWLGEFVELCVTGEIYNEIDRHRDALHRTRQRARVERFRVLPSDKPREDKVVAELERLFPEKKSDSDRSDMRQLARTVVGGATYFVTRDGPVRDQADELYERFGLVVVSPYELVLRFDELRREEEYRPKRFIAPGIKQAKPRGHDDLERIADLLHVGQPSPEPRNRTLARLRDIVAAPDRFDISCITGYDGSMIAAYAIDRQAPDILRVPLFSVADSAIGRTAAHHFTEKLTMLATTEGRPVIMVMGNAGGRRIDEALVDAGFSRERDGWLKLALPVVASAHDLALEVDRVGTRCVEAKSFADRVMTHLCSEKETHVRQQFLARVERVLWPAKIVGTELPCYIVPIRPYWAQHLFDVDLAEQTLFGADLKLLMNSENAFYRAARPPILTAPARVLWYVSRDSAYPGTKTIRACSYLDEVLIAPPKEAFRRFQRLGVYKWSNVFELANNDLGKKVMAFRFSKTEMLRRPVAWKRIQDELRRHGGRASQFQSPLRVDESCFMELYKIGLGGA